MYARLLLCCFVLLADASVGLNIPTKEIAPGVHMPVVSIGTWTEGTKKADVNISEIVGNWLDLGARGIDTAYIYFDQKEVAAVIASRGIARKDLFLTSKIPTCLGKSATRYFVDYDLNRLNTSYIDLMLIHAPGLPGPWGGCDDTWSVLEEYQSKGKLRSIGVSNWGAKTFRGLKYTVPPAVNQIDFNVYSHDDDVTAFCESRNITIEAWSPLGDPARSHTSIFADPVIKGISAKHNVSAAQVALKWIVQKGHVLTFLSSSKDHQANDADLFGFSLLAEDMSQLDKLQKKSAAIVV